MKPGPANKSHDAIKHYQQGAHLLVDPAETLERVMPLMAEMGITRIANVTGLDRIGIPVVMVCRPNSRSIAVSQGKGFTLNAAKASGLMESIESWHAERIELSLKLASFEQLSGNHSIIDVDRLPDLRGTHYDPHLPILWVEGDNLLDDQPLWLPYETVHTYYAYPPPQGSGCFAQSSNGLASGNHYLEAVSHAICECVERDATSLWHQRDQQEKNATKIALDSIDDPVCVGLIDRLHKAQLSVTLWNTTSDTGIPCVDCVLLDEDNDLAHPGVGAGCHPSRSIALIRALTEAVQVRTTYIAGSRDDLTHAEFTPEQMLDKNLYFRKLADGQNGKIDYCSLPNECFDNFRDDVDWLLSRLQAVGIDQVACIDLTRPEYGIPVVRVVVPGLEGPHDDDDYVPGPRATSVAS